MAQEIVLFHSGYGRRPAVTRFAERLRTAGHKVQTPDLFEGQLFGSLAEGVRHRDTLGIPELMGRAQAAVEALPAGLVFAGFSMGTGPAELMAATRPGARGAVLMHGCFTPADFGVPAWPAMVPVQIHYAEGDVEMDLPSVAGLEAAVAQSGARVETHAYAEGGHLFADEDLPDYNQASAELMLERVLRFLAEM